MPSSKSSAQVLRRRGSAGQRAARCAEAPTVPRRPAARSVGPLNGVAHAGVATASALCNAWTSPSASLVSSPRSRADAAAVPRCPPGRARRPGSPDTSPAAADARRSRAAPRWLQSIAGRSARARRSSIRFTCCRCWSASIGPWPRRPLSSTGGWPRCSSGRGRSWPSTRASRIGRGLEAGFSPGEDRLAELQRVPVDDDRGQQVEAGPARGRSLFAEPTCSGSLAMSD